MDGIRIGFSGTRDGMTAHQEKELIAWVEENRDVIIQFTHGCCIGSDEQAHSIVRKICHDNVTIVGRPGFATGHPMRSDCRCDTTEHVQAPMDRNRAIVHNSDILIFTPKFPQLKRSGTWATLKFARDVVKKPVIVLAPWEYGDAPGVKTGRLK